MLRFSHFGLRPLAGLRKWSRQASGTAAALTVMCTVIFASPPPAIGQEQAQFDIIRQTGHANGITAVALSPDGNLALSGSHDGTLRLWDVSSGLLLRTIQAHDAEAEGAEGVTSVLFSPDGRRLLSGNFVTLRLWDAASGALLRTIETRTSRFGSTVAFSPDGRQLLSGDQDNGPLHLWDAASGTLLRTFKGHTAGITAVAFSPDGRLVLSASGFQDSTILLWDAVSGQQLRTFKGHSTTIRSLAFSSDVTRVLSGGYDTALRLWDITSGSLLRSFDGHTGGSHLVAMSADERQLLSVGYEDRTVRVWDVVSGKLLKTIQDDVKAGLHAVALSADRRRLLSGGGEEKALRLWDVATGQVQRTFAGDATPVRAVALSPDGSRVLSGGGKGNALQVWDSRNIRLLRTVGGSGTGTNLIALSKDGSRALLGGVNEGALRLTDTTSEKALRTFPGHTGAISADGRHVLASAKNENDHSLRLWDAGSGAMLRVLRGHTGRAHSVAFSPDGRRAISGGEDITLRLWDTASGKLLRAFESHPADRERGYYTPTVTSVAFSPDGRYVAAGGQLVDGNPTLRLWSTTSDKILRTFTEPPHTRDAHADGITTIAFSPDGSRMLSGSGYNKVLRLWNVASGKLLRTFKGHAEGVSSAVFSVDGLTAISGSFDGTIKFWHIESGALLTTLAARPDGQWIALTPEGFFSASTDGTAVLHVVRGLGVTTMDQVHQTLFNPDLVREKLAGDPQGEVRSAAKVAHLEKVVDSGPAPEVAIEPFRESAQPTSDLVAVQASITDKGKGIGRIEWRVNGVTAVVATKPSGQGPKYSVSQQLALDAGENLVEVVAYNASNLLASRPARTVIKFTAPTATVKPTLHILAIGINQYIDRGAPKREGVESPRFGPLALAVKDAQTLAEDFKRAGTTHYETVSVTLALDEGATGDKLERIVDRLAAEIHPRDTFVLFAAGHGYSHSGQFYFIPQDYSGGADPAALDGRAIGQIRLQDWLANRIKAKRAVVLLDTCESGALVAGHLRSRIDNAASEAGVGRLHEATGRPVLTAAALGQFAFEGLIAGSGNRHGLFTYAVLEALRSGDTNGNGSIELSELVAHVQMLVPKLAADLGGAGRTASSVVTQPGTQQSARFGSRGEDFALVGSLK